MNTQIRKLLAERNRIEPSARRLEHKLDMINVELRTCTDSRYWELFEEYWKLRPIVARELNRLDKLEHELRIAAFNYHKSLGPADRSLAFDHY